MQMVYGQLTRNYTCIEWLGAKDLDSSEHSNMFVAVPYLSNDFEVLQLIDVDRPTSNDSADSTRSYDPFDGLRAEVRTTCHTLHRVNMVEVHVYDDFVLTWSMGGDVEMWDKSTWTMLTRIRAMNVYARGVRKAITDHSMQ